MADALLAEFQEIFNRISELFGSKDFKGLAEVFAEDCRFMPPGSDLIMGREDIEKAHAFIYNSGTVKATFTVLEVIPYGEDMATERSSYISHNKEGEVVDEGKIVTVRKKVNGKWLFYFNIFNSNRPSGGVTASANK